MKDQVTEATEYENPLLVLADGAILKIKDNAWIESTGYCDTCAGETVAKDLTIETTQGSWRYDFGEDGDRSISVEFIMGLVLPNLAEIQAMTVLGFIDWFTKRLRKQANSKYETFKVVPL
jgi:hypothetical protein